jgi:Thymidine kinase
VIRLFPNCGGWLEVVCGPMFSGKSEELIRRLRRAEIAGQRALIVKPRLDSRYDIGHVVSHAGARMRAVAVDEPAEIPGLVDGYDVVGIDEVQFFPPEIVLILDGLVEGCASSRVGSTRTSAASPSARCRSCCAARSSWTSCKRCATAAAGRRR